MRFLWALLLIVVILVGGALVYIYSGAYNIAATDPHNPVVRWALDTTAVRSVKSHADGIVVPPDLTAKIEAGAMHYKDTCAMCHGAPGAKAGEIAQGLKPAPPELSEEAKMWSPEEVFWIVKNGMKMTGMPAWGPTHSDEELWEIVAFVEAMPVMSPEEYRGLTEQAGKSGASDH